MTHDMLPPRAALKDQARRLRATMADGGTALSHSAALEAIARQWGYRDWNTLSAAAPDEVATPRWQVGQRVTGQYLGHGFTGRIKAVEAATGGYWRLVLVFDEAVDVAASALFSAFRRQIRCTVNGQGITAERTSDGQPHVVLRAA